GSPFGKTQPADEEKRRLGSPFGKTQGRPRYLHITIRRTGEQERDSERLGQVHSLLQSYEGDDRFSLYLVSDERRVRLDFPNATTTYCPALEEALVEMLGAGAIRVENQ
ncbi:MAG: hypothetical protein KAX26_16260, partial [Anaerolineae bacterium]|nr:hypothetical protein [Anaerolineae bacterium]